MQWLQGDSEALLYGLITLKRAVHVYGDAESRFAVCEVSVYAESALLYENTGGVTACLSHLEVATYEAP